MNRIKLYYHGGSKNHGCEAIVRSTSKIINKKMDLFTTASQEDYYYHLDKIVDIYDDQDEIIKRWSIKFILSSLQIKIKNKTIKNTKYRRKNLLSKIKKGDVLLSIGGDNYCYAGIETLSDLNYLINKKKAKTVLWGCSINPEVLNEDVIEDLKRYSLITVRETLTYEGLKKAGITDNVVLCSDPAFQLDKIDLPLPEGFIVGETIGINISPLVIESGINSDIVLNNFRKIIEYIISNTTYQIALIPHVIKEGSNDLSVLEKIHEEYKDSNRLILLEDYNCMELKGFISRCRFFIGARTHATIAAYSTYVPTLVLGYSIKAKGIAIDIFGTYENYVVSAQSLKEDTDLLEAFEWIMDNEKQIIDHLHNVMPEYCAKSLTASKYIKELL